MFEDGDAVAIRSAKEHFTRPAIDPPFVSAARWYGERVMGILLSGGGSDGAVGMVRIKEMGGMSPVQRPDEAPHPSMPVTALREDHVDAALLLADLVRVIPLLARGKSVRLEGPPNGSSALAPRQPG